ncbi:MAG TPA: hypothetical protein VNZ44_09390 [Pyrinomonadaceae bacterium]|nr:hypothetical protein [Pyrinomonadaceae bacterium]
MRNRSITAVGLVLVLSLASLSFKCGNGGSNDNSNPVRTASRAADAIAKSIGEMNKVKRELARQGKISSAEELKLTQQLLKLNTADKAVVNRLKAMNAAPTSAERPQLMSLFNELTTALDDLDRTGVVSLGDADARARLATIITTIRSSVAIIQTFVGAIPNSDANPNG